MPKKKLYRDRLCFKEYCCVAAVYDELISYICAPENNVIENMHLVIRNIFDNSAYNQNVDIDFSSIDTRVTEA